MDTTLFADPDCPLCSDDRPGRVKTGPNMTDWMICPCAIAGQRRVAAMKMVETSFPPRAKDMTFDNFQDGGLDKNILALQVAQNFCENYLKACERGWTVMFWGKPAAGKTHIAMSIANECVRRYLAKTHFVNVPALLKAERERYGDSKSGSSEITKASEAELLILDDFGAQYDRLADNTGRVSWVQEQIYEILDARFMNNRPTIVTSNLAPSDMERQLGEAGARIWSRIERSIVGQPVEMLPVIGANKQDEEDTALLFAKP